MKILLIQPPVLDFYQTSMRTQPIGLAYLAASLQARGYEVEILDCQAGKKKSIPVPSELSYLRDLYPFGDRSPFKLYTGYYHFGMGWGEIRKKIGDSKADLFGISSSFTPYHGEALKVARIIKEWNKKNMVVMGGSHVSSEPEGVLRSPDVDYIVLGEGEFRFPALVEQIQKGRVKEISGIDGVGYRTDGEMRIHPLRDFIQDLNSLPFPERGLLDPDRYRINGKRSTMLITSRGCPHGCAYCSTHLVMGSSFRVRNPENILQEMRECHRKYGIEVFDLEDDNFTYDLERAKRLMKLVMDAFGEKNIELTAMNGVSFASLDGEVLGLMKRAGFHTVNLSYVSSDPSTKERMRRPRERTDFNQILKKAEEVGLKVIAYAILGMPDQTIEEMVDTLIYLMGKKVLVGPSIYYPVPGTPLFQRCKEDGILPSNLSQWRSSGLPIETKEFNRLDMVTLLRLARVINFIKGKMDRGELEVGITWEALFQGLKDKATSKNVIPAKAGIQKRLKSLDSRFRGSDEYGIIRASHKVKAEDGVILWPDILLMLLKERSFFSLRKVSRNGFSMVQEKTSKRVLDYFLKSALEKPILKSRND